MDKSQIAWKKQQQSSTRAVCVSLRNSTSYTLLRISTEIKHGTWSCFPPEKILPNTVSEFGTNSIGPINGTEASVFYSVEGSEELGSFSFSWTNPFIGNRAFNATVPNRLFNITEKISSNPYSEISWVVESRAGPKRAVTQGYTATITRQLSQSSAPQKVVEWKQVVARSTRSVVVTIENKTRHKLVREEEQVGTGSIWALLPPETILPNSNGQCAAIARAFLNGVYAKLSYSVGGKDISFSNSQILLLD